MKQCKQPNWAVSTAIVASITAAAVLGTAVPASASSGAASATAVAVKTDGSDARLVGNVPLAARTAPAGTESQTQGGAETKSWSSIIRAVINALKKIPALWKKVADGVKKSYATFKSKVWPAIKATVGAISTLVTAWDIWKYFN